MPKGVATETDRVMMKAALREAREGYEEGGVPVGSVIAEGDTLLASGRNRRVQDSNPVAHAETDCLRQAGRRRNYKGLTLYTTVSPCTMCAATIVQFKISRVVVGEARSFEGNMGYLERAGVDVVLLDDPDCVTLTELFARENPDLWIEDGTQD
ncbi:MAG: nucleoside deaminase [Rhodospirillaceae bacterium]|nr:nucleoside deaminase [Rhodospirillaceae bacterium]